MIIAKDKVVSVTYELTLAKSDGDILEKVNNNRPLTFIQGRGNLLPKFESNLNNLKVGDNFDFVLKSEEAYGPVTHEAIVNLPKSVFVVNGELDEDLLKIGNVIPMTDQSGNRFNGKVLELAEENVKMDFNHPLAGEDLHFSGQVVDVREATSDELEHGHIGRSEGCNCNSNCDCNSNSNCEDSCC